MQEYHRCPHTPGRQGHDAFKGRLERDDIVDDRQWFAYPDTGMVSYRYQDRRTGWLACA
ncbi:MAG: hypothetical protein HFG56_10825 [Lachnospiraceae bacterium]|nr:hypothetical protein [Lachnospiraceae bacterium]